MGKKTFHDLTNANISNASDFTGLYFHVNLDGLDYKVAADNLHSNSISKRVFTEDVLIEKGLGRNFIWRAPVTGYYNILEITRGEPGVGHMQKGVLYAVSGKPKDKYRTSDDRPDLYRIHPGGRHGLVVLRRIYCEKDDIFSIKFPRVWHHAYPAGVPYFRTLSEDEFRESRSVWGCFCASLFYNNYGIINLSDKQRDNWSDDIQTGVDEINYRNYLSLEYYRDTEALLKGKYDLDSNQITANSGIPYRLPYTTFKWSKGTEKYVFWFINSQGNNAWKYRTRKVGDLWYPTFPGQQCDMVRGTQGGVAGKPWTEYPKARVLKPSARYFRSGGQGRLGAGGGSGSYDMTDGQGADDFAKYGRAGDGGGGQVEITFMGQ